MGRSKTTAKQKTTTPIPFPHDGPIFRWYQEESGNNHKDDGPASSSAEIAIQRSARAVLKRSVAAETSDAVDDDDDDDEVTAAIHALCRSLRLSDTTKDQLQALQTFRNKLQHAATKQQQQQQLPCKENRGHAIWGLYQLLLEWSLSHQTPLPFQRAVQSLLKSITQLVLGDCQDKERYDEEISRVVLQTIIDVIPRSDKLNPTTDILPPQWKNPMHSLEVALNYAPLLKVVQGTSLLEACLERLTESESFMTVLTSEQEYTDQNLPKNPMPLSQSQLDSVLQVVGIFKNLFASLDGKNGNGNDPAKLVSLLVQVESFVSLVMTCPSMPNEGFNTLGILYGKLVCLNPVMMNSLISSMMQQDQSIRNATQLSSSCLETISSLKNDRKAAFCPLARHGMVQGIAAAIPADALVLQLPMEDNTRLTSPLESCWRYSLDAGKESTEPMVRWAALKGLSTLASRWNQQQQEQGNHQGKQQYQAAIRVLIDETLGLVFDSWENPPMRRMGTAIPGLFRILVELLPQSEIQRLFRKVLEQPVNRKGRYLAMEILLPHMRRVGIWDHKDTNTSKSLPIDSLLDGVGDQGPSAGAIADLWIKVLKFAWDEIDENGQCDAKATAFKKWSSYWIPQLSMAMLDESLVRRKQVIAFCIPRIVDCMRSVKSLREHVPMVFAGLLEEITRHAELSHAIESTETSLEDKCLWVKLEIVRYTSSLKLDDSELKPVIANTIPSQTFRNALIHSSPSIRLASFTAMEPIVSSREGYSGIGDEILLWKFALPYSIKANESKEYRTHLLQSLCLFLDRLSVLDAERSKPGTESDLPSLKDFVVDFLLNELVLQKGGYPGTVADKETFCIAILDCVLTFSTQDHEYGEDNIFPQNGIIFNRKRSTEERASMDEILTALLNENIFSFLLALVHSVWDPTRTAAFNCLIKLAVFSKSKRLQLPPTLIAKEQRDFMYARGLHLTSSPRQREADTGSRILAFLYAVARNQDEKKHFLASLSDLINFRISKMADLLKDILSGSSTLEHGAVFPLAHGLIHAARLCIEQNTFESRLPERNETENSDSTVAFYEEMVDLFCNSLVLSLSVVADIREGETIDGMDEGTFDLKPGTGDSTPLNVNTAAIGANGTFSSVSNTDENEVRERLATQRIVVGTWLLTKEACAAIATVVALPSNMPQREQVSRVGQLLLSTLTGLKHAGAAFAARDALQQISSFCLSAESPSELRSLPEEWSNRLMDEIALTEKVRNSTLRRSTGYALGFMAIMRAGVLSTAKPAVNCRTTLDNLLKLSLPPEHRLEEIFAELGLKDAHLSCISDAKYETRCRVHALNVLRMLILDAPLSKVISSVAGDAIVSSILGYNDLSWSIRNSSTMVFAATMLRVVDADKNASNADKTSNNAITITELFRRYPLLSTFLPSALMKCLDAMDSQGVTKSELVPILGLLSRVQCASNTESTTTVADDFIPLLVRCLGSRDFSIRHAAARALANLCPISSRERLLSDCLCQLKHQLSQKPTDWNRIDGILLAIYAVKEMSKESCVRGALKTMLLYLARQGAPPSCLSTALSIMISYDDLVSQVSGFCTRIVSFNSNNSGIGSTHLFETVAVRVCTMAAKDVFYSSDEASLAKGLHTLNQLFTSPSIDVRLHAVKAFKKNLSQNLAHLQIDQSSSAGTVVQRLSSLLLECTVEEMFRDSTEAVGSHNPTVRRLSRCFLETVNGGTIAISADDTEMLLSLASKMISKDFGELAEVEDKQSLKSVTMEESCGATLLAGNGIEMMAVAVSEIKGDVSAQLRILLRVVTWLNNPYVSWRSRYSAALALERCCKVPSTHEGELSLFSHEIISQILKFLQDSDPDVRAVAVRAANKYCSKNGRLLPEWTLEQTFPLAFKAADLGACTFQINALLQILLDNTASLLPAMEHVQGEFCHSSDGYGKDDTSTDEFLNVNTTRKIFEDEDPNPYQEKLHLNQLAIRSLAQLVNSHPDIPLSPHLQDMLERCDEVLCLLLNSLNTGGFVHDLSRFPSIFPSLWSMLSCVAVLIGDLHKKERYRMKVRNIQISTQKLVDNNKYMHPSILAVLRMICHHQDFTDDNLESLLFLL